MIAVFATIIIASGALVLGAIWGAVWGMSQRVEGFMIALAGGALIVGAMDQMVAPAMEHLPLWAVCAALGVGAFTFWRADRFVEKRVGQDSGEGLALAVTVDGVPENLALGAALIGSTPSEVSALAAAILLSNLPESAGGAKIMAKRGQSTRRIIGLWAMVALLLAASGIGGHLIFEHMPHTPMALIHGFAAGAVISSLATEVFPAAYRDNAHDAGIAVALGVILALMLSGLG
ncbi:MAG: zinc transporter [Rhodobacterales bacterium]|nr:MAG: zinc transporter [Rhodobacterales bacterium]